MAGDIAKLGIEVTGDTKKAVKAMEDLEKSQRKAAQAAYDLASAEDKLFMDMEGALGSLPSKSKHAFSQMQNDLLQMQAGVARLNVALSLISFLPLKKALEGIKAEAEEFNN